MLDSMFLNFDRMLQTVDTSVMIRYVTAEQQHFAHVKSVSYMDIISFIGECPCIMNSLCIFVFRVFVLV